LHAANGYQERGTDGQYKNRCSGFSVEKHPPRGHEDHEEEQSKHKSGT
jgi:hypothetical protein